jgi:uncharacterized membrane protein YukC
MSAQLDKSDQPVVNNTGIGAMSNAQRASIGNKKLGKTEIEAIENEKKKKEKKDKMKDQRQRPQRSAVKIPTLPNEKDLGLR